MQRVGTWIALGVLVVTSNAAADPTQLGLYFGPRIYSDDNRLGYIDDAPAHPTLQNGIQIGARVARPFFPWLVPELEFAIAPTDTTAVGGAAAADVLWLQPRLHLRFEILPERRVMPFIVVGGGAPIVLSNARMTYDSGITGEAYAGAGVRFDTRGGFAFRLDARVTAVPGIANYFTPELDITAGVELRLGAPRRRSTEVPPPGPNLDRDNDGVLGDAAKCPDRAEAHDGFDDLDGCPDTLPADVDALRGTVEGLLYAEGETVVRDSAQPSIQKIAKLMTTYPSIKVVLVGHTDDREANQFATPGENGEPADTAQLAIDLARARAEAVRQSLAAAGIPTARIEIDGVGAADPVSDNGSPKGRLANRRVEIKLYVPPR